MEGRKLNKVKEYVLNNHKVTSLGINISYVKCKTVTAHLPTALRGEGVNIS